MSGPTNVEENRIVAKMDERSAKEVRLGKLVMSDIESTVEILQLQLKEMKLK